MTRIGILSDTHGFVDPKTLGYLESCQEIWHAGDVGQSECLDQLEEISSLKAVYGNIDGKEIRIRIPEVQQFETEGLKVLMIHIAGYPKRYNPKVNKLLTSYHPDIVVCGHSHILKVMHDKTFKHLHINPGAVGQSGFHKVKTLIRLNLNAGKISDLEVIEMKR